MQSVRWACYNSIEVPLMIPRPTKTEAELQESADSIKNARARLGLSPSGLATKLKTTPAMIASWEQGVQAPKPEHIKMIQRLERAHQRYLSGG